MPFLNLHVPPSNHSNFLAAQRICIPVWSRAVCSRNSTRPLTKADFVVHLPSAMGLSCRSRSSIPRPSPLRDRSCPHAPQRLSPDAFQLVLGIWDTMSPAFLSWLTSAPIPGKEARTWASRLVWIPDTTPLFVPNAMSSPLLMFEALFDGFVNCALAAVFHSPDDASVFGHFAGLLSELETRYQ